ncbi:DUF58 domain-containing protein [Haloarchaeobius amylolyticus]|uniref:DUF58 domain-containing protein n=1 Tax=Haloarchaeobius amylolyticus TaxID=1198296 RepID=UPI0022721F20|nr:DUF58 domain-containing protein [Haloarchaeobius amylolyticus]
MTTVDTGRWNVGLTAALVMGALGLFTKNTTLFLAAAIGLSYAAYGYATRPPSLDLAVERSLSTTSPMPGEDVEVTVTVRNESDSPVADVRVVDGVPDTLGVVSGAPRHLTSLLPGEEETFTYTIKARRGVHEFEQATLVTRNISGATKAETAVDLPDRISCRAGIDDVPLGNRTISYTGRIETDTGGEGTEFYQVRKYQRSDPMNRIDWKRFARTGELRTVEFRESRAASVVVVVDTRYESRISRRPEEPDGVELSMYAAGRLCGALLNDGNRVGLARYGGTFDYLEPGTGDEQAVRIRKNLSLAASTTIPVADGADADANATADDDGGADSWQGEAPTPEDTDGPAPKPTPDGGWRVDWLRRRIPNEAQVVFVTPMMDDGPFETLRRLRAAGHEVRVVSPDVTSDESAGSKLESIRRDTRLRTLRGRKTKVIEWSPDQPLFAAIEMAMRRWSA